MEDFVLEILASATVSTALAGLLVWITRSWIAERLKNAIKSEYDQKLETHKAQLKAATDTEVEKLKAQLAISATEHQVKYTKLHESRAEVIAETYALLRDLYDKLKDSVKIFEPAGDLSREERKELAVNAHNALREYYPKKLIFLPESTAREVEKFDMELVKAFQDFVYTVEQNATGERTKKWVEVFKRTNGEIKETLEGLENEFRVLLGDR